MRPRTRPSSRSCTWSRAAPLGRARRPRRRRRAARPGRGGLLRRARALGREHEAGQVGAGLDCHRDVLLAREPADLDQRPRRAAPAAWRPGRAPASAPSRRGSRRRRRARRPHPARVCGCRSRRSRSGRAGCRATSSSCVPVDRERGEVAGVDADHGCAERDRAVELVGVVRLDERVEPELVGVAHQRARLAVVEVAQEQERRRLRRLPGPCAGAPRSRRSPSRATARRCRARGAEVVPAAAEAVVDEDGDGGSARALVVARRAARDRRPGGCRPATASAA